MQSPVRRSQRASFSLTSTAVRIAVLAASMMISHAAIADVVTGRIAGYIPYANGATQLLFVRIEGAPTGGCNTTGRLVIDSNNAHFNATQAAVLAAFHGQAPVTAHYVTTCTKWPYDWDMQFMCIGTVNC